jgi:hypothetical protein
VCDSAREAGHGRLEGASVEDDSVPVNVLRWPALACVILSIGLVGCGKGHPATAAAHRVPVASTPVTPVITPAEAAMSDAARAEVDGRAAEALAAYETLIAFDPPLPPATRVQALIAAARLRLSPDPGLHDLAQARTHLKAALAINPRLSATVPTADLLALIDQDLEAQERASNQRTLRNSVKQLQDELAKAQEELSKKDEALHRATEKLLEKAPRPR